MADLALGVDLGGTKIAVGVFDEQGELLGDLIVKPTLAQGPQKETLAQLFAAIDAAMQPFAKSALRGIGVGTTGPLDPARGVLLEPETLPQFFNFELGAALTQGFDLPFAMTNDANSFALSEAMFGQGRGESVVLGVTIGTGCGVGIVIDGKILEGATGNAGEVYRAVVRDRNFDEALSGSGLARLYTERCGAVLAGEEISSLAESSDADALAVFEDFGGWLATGLGLLVAVIDPNVVVIGGSVSRAYSFFGPTLRLRLPEFVAPAAANVRLACAAETDHSGARGAAALVFSRL